MDAAFTFASTWQRHLHRRKRTTAWPGQLNIHINIELSSSGNGIMQVNTYWTWGDVYSADVYLGKLEQLRDQNASSIE